MPEGFIHFFPLSHCVDLRTDHQPLKSITFLSTVCDSRIWLKSTLHYHYTTKDSSKRM